MRTLSKILVAAAVAALAAPALASAAPSATGTRGIVVQRDARAGVVVVATSGGSLLRVNFAKPMRLAMGTVVKVRGTKVVVVGHRHKAKLRGVVMRRHKHSFALADHGSVVAVTSPTPPAPGQAVTATVQVTPTSLDDDDGDEQVNNPAGRGCRDSRQRDLAGRELPTADGPRLPHRARHRHHRPDDPGAQPGNAGRGARGAGSRSQQRERGPS